MKAVCHNFENFLEVTGCFLQYVQCIPHFSVIRVCQQDLFFESQTTKCIVKYSSSIFPPLSILVFICFFSFKTLIMIFNFVLAEVHRMSQMPAFK